MASALAGLVLAATACSSGDSSHSTLAKTTAKTSGAATSGSGPVRVGGGNGGSGDGHKQSVMGTFTAAFAQCMRAHGVPKFPDPGSKNDSFGLGSGVDPGSPQFQAAVNGPCKSLAPDSLSSGKVTKSGGQ